MQGQEHTLLRYHPAWRTAPTLTYRHTLAHW